jgi:ABC-type dipeptide/oligopeptide/nickel transport system permease component
MSQFIDNLNHLTLPGSIVAFAIIAGVVLILRATILKD